jgi:hypothetical protein
MIAPLTKFIDWSVLQTAEVIGCLGQMSLIFRMVFLATALPVFSFDARADSADGPQTIPQLQAAIETVLKDNAESRIQKRGDPSCFEESPREHGITRS